MLPLPNLSMYLGIGLIAACCAWTIDHSMASTKYARLEASIATKRSEALENALIVQTKLNSDVSDLTQKLHDTEAKYVQFENERDTAIAAGSKRVYVRAQCPSVPTSTEPAARIDGTAAELDPAYRQALSDLRRGANTATAQIIGLQEYARVCASIGL